MRRGRIEERRKSERRKATRGGQTAKKKFRKKVNIKKKEETRKRETSSMSKKIYMSMNSWNKGLKREKVVLEGESMSLTAKSTPPWLGFSTELGCKFSQSLANWKIEVADPLPIREILCEGSCYLVTFNASYAVYASVPHSRV